MIGDNVGYTFGKRVGVKLFTKEDSWLFNKAHLVKAQKFYEEHGRKTIILARFMPIIRTFAPIVAGMGDMNYRVFFLYNIIGGFLWAVGISLMGYVLGSTIPGIDRYLIPIILGIIVLSLLPPIFHSLRYRKK